MNRSDSIAASAFLDHFSQQAADYAMHRPRYPNGLFDYLASFAPRHDLVWDAGTGNGQAAIGLARNFDRVVATDASTAQIKLAAPCERVTYVVAAAEQSPLRDGVADLVTVAQAVHWFDLDRFYSEVRRVCGPGGLLAVWCYNWSCISPQVDAVLRHFDTAVVKPFWPPQSELVHNGFRTLPFSFVEIAAPAFELEADWRLDDLVGYLTSWSSVQRYRSSRGRDPLDEIRAPLAAAWGDPAEQKRIMWPLHLRVGRVGRP